MSPDVDVSHPDAADRRPSDTAVDRELAAWLEAREAEAGDALARAARELPPEREGPGPGGRGQP